MFGLRILAELSQPILVPPIMPTPLLHITDRVRGLPRQPVCLRHAYLICGLPFDQFLRFLWYHFSYQESEVEPERSFTRLRGYQYRVDGEPRPVREQFYKDLWHRISKSEGTGERTLVSMLPPDHFVWSDELAAAFHHYISEDVGEQEAAAWGWRLTWDVSFAGLENLLDECIDLSELRTEVVPAESISAEAPTTSKALYLFRRSNAGAWEITFDGHACGPCKDSRGLHYLKHLLMNPGKELSGPRLSNLVNSAPAPSGQQLTADEDDPDYLSVVTGGDAGEAIDETARKAYEARVRTLTSQIEEAEEIGDTATKQELLAERDSLIGELKSAVTPHGRPRREKATQKRAYDAVKQAIERAQEELQEHCPALAQHLTDSLRYSHGDGWIYEPKPSLSWKFV